MNNITLASDNRSTLKAWLTGDTCVVACLCAAWCDTCNSYKRTFDELASLHPRQFFAWIDIENQADVVGDLDITNFPTLLIQQGDVVSFFGTMQPELRLADRLLRAQLEKSLTELQTEANGTDERKRWQRECNLRTRLE